MIEIQATEPWDPAFEGADISRGGHAKALSSKGWSAIERATGCAYGVNALAVARILITKVTVEVTGSSGGALSVVFQRPSA